MTTQAPQDPKEYQLWTASEQIRLVLEMLRNDRTCALEAGDWERHTRLNEQCAALAGALAILEVRF